MNNSRQSFLDPRLENILNTLTIGIVGVGGGGSHVVQQLSHMGFRNLLIVDPDVIESSNLTRLVGAEELDIQLGLQKTQIATRLAARVNGESSPMPFPADWKDVHKHLYMCDVIFGCVDTFREREQLEAFCRRLLTPYIDIGMTVQNLSGQNHIYGQVILSCPGDPCMKCMGFINDRVLREEANGYGHVGANPQVVWSNGVLASTAVSLMVGATTQWKASGLQSTYLEYDGNNDTLSHSSMMHLISTRQCPHFPEELGITPNKNLAA